MASRVTMLPCRANWSSNAGMAVISLDLSATQRWPSTGPCALAQALTMCSGARSCLRSNERRSVLPSMATTSRSKPAASEAAQAVKQASNASGSISMKTRRNVSCEGMPFGSSRKGPQPSQLAATVERNVVPALGAGDHGADRDYQNVDQRMLDLASATRIHNRPKMSHQPLDGHDLLPQLEEGRSSPVRQPAGDWLFMRHPWPHAPMLASASGRLVAHYARVHTAGK